MNSNSGLRTLKSFSTLPNPNKINNKKNHKTNQVHSYLLKHDFYY